MRLAAQATLACVLAAALPALAEDLVIQHQGRILDAADQPVSGVRSLTIRLYSRSDGTSTDVVWNETYDVTLSGGFYALGLGDTRNSKRPLSADVLAGPRWMGITFEGVEFEPRLPLGTVPSALDAAGLGGRPASEYALKSDVSTNALQLGGLDADEYALKTDLSTNALQLGGLDADEYALKTDAAPNALALGGVPAGDYQLKEDPATNALALGGVPASQYVTLSGSQALTLSGTGTFGTVGLTPQTTPPVCGNDQRGQLYFDATSGSFRGCTASGWVGLRTRHPGDTPPNAAPSCAEIKRVAPTAPDGNYWLDPDGTGPVQPFLATCDMTRDGGGWTLCFSYDNATYDAWNWPTKEEARNKAFARRWGETALGGLGSRQGNFCNLMPVTPNTTRLRGEAVRTADDTLAMSGVFTLKKANFFTQQHNQGTRAYDCLIDETGQKRFAYSNYPLPAKTYAQRTMETCAGAANEHLDKIASDSGGANGIDGLLQLTDVPTGFNANRDLSLHVNWYGDVNTESLYVTAVNDSATKWNLPADWLVNRFGRSGASPGLQFCSGSCGYTNMVTAQWKMRFWVK